MRGRLRAGLHSDTPPREAYAAIAALIRSIRADAREAARFRLQRELQTIVSETPGSAGYDAARSRMVAKSYQEALFSYAKANGVTLEQAVTATDAKARVIAATETSQAYSHERDQAARRISLERGVVLWKVWDAVLDRNTCPRCASMHGRAVPASEDFSGGRPGQVHPLCRCVEIVTTIDHINFGNDS